MTPCVREAARMIPSDDKGWDEEVRGLAVGTAPPDLESFLESLPAGYRSRTGPAQGARDAAEVVALLSVSEVAHRPMAGAGVHRALMGGAHRLQVAQSVDESCTFRLRRFGTDGIELTSMLPLLESFGMAVVEAVPFRLTGRAGADVHIDDIGLRVDVPFGPETLRFVPVRHGRLLVEAIEASAGGDADVDSLNRLVISAALDWRQVTVLRTYLRYWQQLAPDLSWEDLADPLAAHPDAARAIVAYFHARFDQAIPPAGGRLPDGSAERPNGARERALCTGQLDLVDRLEEFRVLHALLGLVDATWRTNYFSAGYSDGPSPDRPSLPPLVLKMDSASVPEIGPPRPYVDTFVHGPVVEGIHLRAGLIARGGLRWSERPADFRTEILDLAFAQVKKNAIIVPTGAKGGFVVRASSSTTGTSLIKVRPSPDQVRVAYEMFVAGLLAITDNIVGGELRTPEGVVALDGPDPYLVVAADKGTATFSDLANSIAEGAGYWLGDAFASGGSRGYDHKAMGITARGAWVAVRRHFRELGVDVATDPIRVVGVGDMSGDVFGNGMLRSRAIRLVAAFDHRHIFLDPDPDGDRSFDERRRMFALERSSWADYAHEAISPGGGVWARDARVVPLSAQARAVLGLAEEELSPPQLVSAILSAPVDLIWFGGIGTFIKAPGESDVDVGDHANDGVRITSDRVRARVVAEGANLGVTQRARIRYSRRGGRINADFIDNAAGVATSDREVNLKILLALAIEKRRLAPAERDDFLSRSEDEVAEEVLRQVDHSVAALNRAAAGSEKELDAYEALIDELEATGRFGREVEVLPDQEEFRVRRAAGAGLIRPELATILAYAKADLVAAIESSGRARSALFADSVLPYFPAPIRGEFADLVAEHRLYPQLVATDVAGEIVDQMGIVWAHDLAAEMGRDLSDVAEAFWVARRVTGAGQLWADLEKLATDPTSGVSAPAEAALHEHVAAAVGSLVRTYLRSGGRFDPIDAVGRDEALLAAHLQLTVAGASGPQPDWVGLEIPESVGARFQTASRRVSIVWAGLVASSVGCPVHDVLEALAQLDRATGVDRLEQQVRAGMDTSPPPGRIRSWQARAVLDDLSDWRSRAVAASLAPADARTGDQGTAVSRWAESHRLSLQRASLIIERAPAGSDPLALVALTLRRLGTTVTPG